MSRTHIILALLALSLVSSKFLDEKSHLYHLEHSNSYSSAVSLINSTVLTNPEHRHQAWEKTAYIVDTVGPRLWGSRSLEIALDTMHKNMIEDGFENVRLEEIKDVPVWSRGEERLTLLAPREVPTRIPLIGLGLSVGGNITADVVLVNSFEELAHKKVEGKIVFFNAKWNSTYSNTVVYRAIGPSEAAKRGAVGVLIRSITPLSVETPHTGALQYEEGVKKIPAAAISLEDSDMFERMAKRGQTIRVNLLMSAKWAEKNTTSYNLIGEIRGSEYPEEIVLMGGHVDSWDTGPQTGANDDLAGFFVCYEAVRTLLKLNLRPKRTIRVIGWSGEEMGLANNGAAEYVKRHKDELKNHVIGFESDAGTLDLYGFGFSGSSIAFEIVRTISEMYLEGLKMDHLSRDGVMVDTTPIYENNIPVMKNLVNQTFDESEYFLFHHTAADSMNVLDPHAMDRNVIGIASMFYIIADLPNTLPKNS